MERPSSEQDRISRRQVTRFARNLTYSLSGYAITSKKCLSGIALAKPEKRSPGPKDALSEGTLLDGQYGAPRPYNHKLGA